MTHPTEPQPEVQTADTADALEPAGPSPCRCSSRDHEAVRIGEEVSASGAVTVIYVCPAVSAAGLQGAL